LSTNTPRHIHPEATVTL